MERFDAAVERPSCKRCGIRTMLTRIALDAYGFEVRSFGCPKCDVIASFFQDAVTDVSSGSPVG
jgi:hypothetical protein